MLDDLGTSVAAGSGRKLHGHDVDGLVGKRRERILFTAPHGDGAIQPIPIVPLEVVLSEMGPPALRALERAVSDAEGELEHHGDPVSKLKLGIRALDPAPDADTTAPDEQCLELLDGV